MVDFPIDTNIFKIGDQIVIPISRIASEDWFDEDITILTSNANKGTTIVIDFSYSIPTVISYTLNGGVTYVDFNESQTITGGQSRYIRVRSGDKVNFRAVQPGVVIRCVVGEV